MAYDPRKMILTFYGGTKTVTGANYLLETKEAKVLIDCGLIQGEHFLEKQNLEPFPYNAKEIDAVFVTHAHIDHTGRLPRLYKEGFRGEIFSTPPTRDFAEQLLIDSEHLLSKEAEQKNEPQLYTLADVNETIKLWHTVKYRQKMDFKDLEIEFYDAGHILGSSSIVFTEKTSGKKIAFSGDLGNVAMPMVKDTEKIKGVDYALIESAYGGRLHENMASRKDQLEDIIEDTAKTKGVLMIPAFAMERTQELLYELNSLVEGGRVSRIPVFIDSPLAIKLTAIYQKYSQDPDYFDRESLMLMEKGDKIFDFPGLRTALTSQQSKEINNFPAPKVIMAGSGMSNGGRIIFHEQRYLSEENNTILFIGYQAEGTLGRRIQDGAESVRILGVEIPVRCRVASISGYSAHADQAKLLEWLKPMKETVKKVFIVQGEENQMLPLKQKITDELALDAAIPEYGQKIVL